MTMNLVRAVLVNIALLGAASLVHAWLGGPLILYALVCTAAIWPLIRRINP